MLDVIPWGGTGGILGARNLEPRSFVGPSPHSGESDYINTPTAGTHASCEKTQTAVRVSENFFFGPYSFYCYLTLNWCGAPTTPWAGHFFFVFFV